MAQRSLKVVSSLKQSSSARKAVATSKRARPPQSSGVKLWAQASAAATFTKRFCHSTRSSCSARLALAIKSLQPSPELSSASFRRRSPRRVDQQRAQLPQSSLQPSQLRLQAGNISATPSVEIAAALASTMAQRLLKVVTQTLEIRIFILRWLELKECAAATLLGRFTPLPKETWALVTQLLEARAGRQGVDGWLWRFRREQAAEDSSGKGCSDLVASASRAAAGAS